MAHITNEIELRFRELEKLSALTNRINNGLLLEEILENVYLDFRDLIPYDRIGVAEIRDGYVKLIWTKSDNPTGDLSCGYRAALSGSSLQRVMETSLPRIINDLPAHLAANPASESTAMIVKEGMRSSLTCPLIANGIPAGFLFFSSKKAHTYDDVHVALYQKIAAQLSMTVEKGRLMNEVLEQKSEIDLKNKELHQLNKLKSKFVGMAAHDLRGPITVVRNITEMLLDEQAEDDSSQADTGPKSMLRIAYRKCEQMLELIDNLLDLTAIDTGNIKLSCGPATVADLVAEAVSEQNSLASGKGSTIECLDLPQGTLWCDRKRVAQVLDNLLSNAVKYSPPASVVRLAVLRADERWRFEVIDQGPGVSETEQQRLFQDFARLSARPTAGETSTGLGLAIAKRIVVAHGGEIGFTSLPGKGAIFWFTLPGEPAATERNNASAAR